jgi:cardiolipin synthase
VRVVADSRRHRPTEKILLRVCNAARHEILITNQYFIPTPPLVDALTRAADRGVDVQLVVPRMGRPIVAGLATDHCLGRLLAAGIKVWRWNGPMMHAKTVVVDRSWSLVGSSNVDPLSFRFNAELNLEVHGTAAGKQMAAIFTNDLRTCTLYTRDDWRSRSLAWRGLTRLVGLAGPIL